VGWGYSVTLGEGGMGTDLVKLGYRVTSLYWVTNEETW